MTIRDHIVCVLEKSSLIAIIVGSLIASSMYATRHPYVAPPAPPKTGVHNSQPASAITATDVISLTNQNRQQAGVPSLATSQLLTQAAQAKAYDMASKGYYAHVSPEGKSPLYWFDLVGYHYQNAGENLVIDRTTSAQVVDAWMASPDHRDNILRPQFTEIGVGTADGVYEGMATTYVVQEFGMPLPAKYAPAPKVITKVATVPVQVPTPSPAPAIVSAPAHASAPVIPITPPVAAQHPQPLKLPSKPKTLTSRVAVLAAPLIQPTIKSLYGTSTNSASGAIVENLMSSGTVFSSSSSTPAAAAVNIPLFALPEVAPIVIPVMPNQYTNEPVITPRPALPREPAFTVIVHTFNNGFQDMIRKYVPI